MTPISSTSLARSSSSIRSHMNAPTSAIGASGSATRWSCCWRRACAWPTPAGAAQGGPGTGRGMRNGMARGSPRANCCSSPIRVTVMQSSSSATSPRNRERCSDVIVAADPAMHHLSDKSPRRGNWSTGGSALPTVCRLLLAVGPATPARHDARNDSRQCPHLRADPARAASWRAHAEPDPAQHPPCRHRLGRKAGT